MSPQVAIAAARRSAGDQEAFQRYLDGLVHAWLGTVSALGFTLVPFFFILDIFVAPRELLFRFGVLRGLSTVVCLAIFVYLRRSTPGRYSFVLGYVIAAVVAGPITQMTVDLGGFESGYYAGLNLVIGGINLFLPWRPVHSAANGMLVVAMYVVGNALFGAPFRPEIFAANLFFMLATVVIAVAITYAKLELIKREYNLRSELLDANALLDMSRQELKAARDALWGEMEVAKRIQTALLPRDQRAGPYEVAAAMFPAAEVGGDYYDIVSPPGGRHWIAVGDVSGHGVESGLVMMMTQTAILTRVREAPDAAPSSVFGAVNGVICENVTRLGSGRYMTLNVVRLDDGGLTLAGRHQDILVWRRAERRVETFTNDGCWIGVIADVASCTGDAFLPLGPGDVALFFTDGVTEARNPEGEQFGEERLAAALARVGDGPLAEAIRVILEEVSFFSKEQSDDMTLLVLRRAEG